MYIASLINQKIKIMKDKQENRKELQLVAIPISHADVRGKIKYHLQIINTTGEDHFIHIGEGTYKKLEETSQLKTQKCL